MRSVHTASLKFTIAHRVVQFEILGPSGVFVALPVKVEDLSARGGACLDL